MTQFKHFLVALLIVFLHLGSQFGTFLDEDNRFYYLWHFRDGLARVLLVLLLGSCLYGGVTATRYCLRRWDLRAACLGLDHLLPLALLSGVLALFPSWIQSQRLFLVPTIWIVAFGLVAFSLGRGSRRLVKWSHSFALVFSPLVFLIVPQVFLWSTWEEAPRTELAQRPAKSSEIPVFVFMFDEWSYPRSVECGRFHSFLESLNELANTSVVYLNARSPATETMLSLPRFIYQLNLDFVWRGGKTYWKNGDHETVSAEMPSLFQRSRENGYNTYLLGWYLPYDRILGSQVDYCHVHCTYPKGESLASEMIHALREATASLSDPVGQKIGRSLPRKHAHTGRHAMQKLMHAECSEILRTCPRNSFAVLHLIPPHAPFVFEHDGRYRKVTSRPAADGYQEQLRYVDRLIGEYLDILRERNLFDDALIIITSDHSWRDDPDPQFRPGEDWKQRVPLLIKLPGQSRGEVVEERTYSNELLPLFEAVFEGDAATAGLRSLLVPPVDSE